MKNYYYFLGIEEDASSLEIKQAFRKLSLKYHPDKNDNDAFFAHRFMEIQEAYEILSDAEKRRIYDDNLTHQQRSYRPNLPPSIKTFSASKIRVKKGEEITINWQTNNADIVKILPFGLEKGYGERTFKITEFKDGKFQILLNATNSLLNKTVARGITITEVFETDPESFPQDVPADAGFDFSHSVHKTSSKKSAKLVLALFFIVLAILLLIKTFVK